MRNELIIATNLLKVFFSNFTLSQLLDFRKKSLIEKDKNYRILTSEFIPFLQIIQPKNSKVEIKCQIEDLAIYLGKESEYISIIKLLFYFSDLIIKRYNNHYKFSYEYCDIWRDASSAVDEDFFVISKILQENKRRMIFKDIDFSWPYCIEHDNVYISNILNSGNGVSDNHFHLRGSSPYYQMSWIRMMSNVIDERNELYLSFIDNKRLYFKSFYSTKSIDEPLSVLHIKAAAIRLYLFLQLKENYCDSFCKETLFTILDAKSIAIDTKIKMQTIIEKIKFKLSDQKQIDYIETNDMKSCYYDLIGERWLIYTLLGRYRSKDIEILTLIYLSIKNRFRAELVQTNSLIGYNNFMLYQDRKDWFLPWSYLFEKKLAKATIASVLDGPKLNSLELRISPAYPYTDDIDLSEENAKMIELYDSAIEEAILFSHKKYSLNNFYYTIHFVKKSEQIKDTFYMVPRHNELRELIKKQADSILDMRNNYPELGKRIHGIDACNDEMDCRPEVFAVEFRKMIYYENNPRQEQIKATFHVGEDNYDVIDGLRAIHEAILFLDLKSGNRLGHATLLGISVDKYISRKNMQISIPLQNLVDNYVWVYYFILNHIEMFSAYHEILSYIQNKYNDYVEILFNDGRRKKIVLPSINQYYQAWLLRGDDPYLYQGSQNELKIDTFNGYKLCNSIPQMAKARESSDVRHIYYLYHYDKIIRQNGKRPISKTISPIFGSIVSQIQKIMRNMISKKGIGIESNPTSNLMISAIEKYSEHPLSIFYNKGLVGLSNDTQINVSVNTDDKSVFSTNISNEYAYLAFELENQRNDDNSLMYNPANIYEWIELLKKNGNNQSFIRNTSTLQIEDATVCLNDMKLFNFDSE